MTLALTWQTFIWLVHLLAFSGTAVNDVRSGTGRCTKTIAKKRSSTHIFWRLPLRETIPRNDDERHHHHPTHLEKNTNLLIFIDATDCNSGGFLHHHHLHHYQLRKTSHCLKKKKSSNTSNAAGSLKSEVWTTTVHGSSSRLWMLNNAIGVSNSDECHLLTAMSVTH